MPILRRVASITALAVALLATGGAHASDLHGTTSLRLDAVDTSGTAQGRLVLYASFLDKYRKPLVVTDPTKWTVLFDGETAEMEINVKRLADSERGVAVVVVVAAYEAFKEELYEHSRSGSARLLNGLRGVDTSGVVTYATTVDATGGLSPSHNEAVNWLSERKVGGPTPLLYEAIEKGLEFFPTDFSSIGPNRALIIVSDGWDKYTFERTKMKDQVQKVQRMAQTRNVRINVIGVAVEDGDDDSDGLQALRKVSNYTGGTYRPAYAATGIEEFLGHQQSELTGQHVLEVVSDDLDGPKEMGFKVEVDHEARKYASDFVTAYVEEPESHLLNYLLVGAGVLVVLVLLGVVIRVVVGMIRNRPVEVYEELGPETRECPQCHNMIQADWRVCRYCEALPHLGRLTVRGIGELNGTTFFITDKLTNIGSAEGNTVVVSDQSVSKRHAGIKADDNRFELADFGSTNGVLVNGTRITKQFLKNGDVISIGAIELEFSLK